MDSRRFSRTNMSNVSKENMLNRSHNNEKLILLSESEIIKNVY